MSDNAKINLHNIYLAHSKVVVRHRVFVYASQYTQYTLWMESVCIVLLVSLFAQFYCLKLVACHVELKFVFQMDSWRLGFFVNKVFYSKKI